MMIAKLFTNGSSQAVRLPKEMRFDGNEVYVKKVGSSIMLFPKDKAFETFLEGISEFTDDYFDILSNRSNNIESPRETI